MATQRKTKKDREADKKLLTRIRDRYKVMSQADQENRRDALDDLKFVNVPGAQWDENMKKERGDRPCYEFNKLRINGKRVINEIRANRPQGKVRAVEGGDKDTAEIYEGLIRNIWNVSDGDTVIDSAAEYQVDAGMGAWRIETEYSDDSVFDQDICIRAIKNPMCLYADPSCQDPMKRDAEDWILTERISKASYEAKYGKAEKIDFQQSEFDDEDEWEDDETVRICEYWYKEPYDKEIWLVEFQGPDGPNRITVDSTSDEAEALMQQPGFEQTIVKRRTAKCHRIMMCIVSGESILEGPVEWAGSMFPFIMIYGEYKVVDGKVRWWGLHRFSRDAQQSYNVSRTAIDETIANAPKATTWVTAEQAKGHTESWGEAHRKNFPIRLYNSDPKAPGVPQHHPGADVPVALIQQAQIAAQDMRDTTGLHEASFGEESGEKSGIALARKQGAAQIVTYNFPDNMAKGIRRTWEILIDLIPEIYDAERELRIIGSDGAEDYKRVNQVVYDESKGQTLRVNDLSAGKYDVVITVGPSFSTLRQEAAETYGHLSDRFPEMMGVAGDLVFKAMDLPYADEIAERLQILLPPQIQQMLANGKSIPPEAQAVMAQANQAMQQVQEQTQLIQQAAQEVQDEQAKSEKAKSEVKELLANLDTAQARFDADIAKKMADLAIKEAGIRSQEAQASFDTQSYSQANDAVKAIDDMVASFMESAAAIMQELEVKTGIRVDVPEVEQVKKPRLIGISTKRVNGELIAIPEYEGEGPRVTAVRAKRENGELVAVPEYDTDSEEPRIARVRAARGPDGSLNGVPEYEESATQ